MILDAPTTAMSDRRLTVQAEPLLVSARDAGRLCGVSERTWRGWDSSGRCPEAMISGGCKRWSYDQLRAWVSAGAPSRARWVQIQE